MGRGEGPTTLPGGAAPGDRPLDIVFVASEISPFIKVGGLADVVFGLAAQLIQDGHKVECILPKYYEGPHVKYKKCHNIKPCPRVPKFHSCHAYQDVEFVAEVGTVSDDGGLHHIPVVMLDTQCPTFERFAVYNNKSFASFSMFCRAALDYLLSLRIQHNRQVDVLHLNDWSSALVAPLYYTEFYEKGLNTARVLLTVHNAAEICQGTIVHVPDVANCFIKGLPRELMYPNKHDLGEHCILLKGAIEFSDKVVIVSPNYRDEILADRSLSGERLYPIICKHEGKMVGILNGIDYAEWNPATDQLLAVNYSADMDGATLRRKKLENKNALRKLLAMPVPEKEFEWNDFMVGCVARLTEQKGVHHILHAIGWAHKNAVQMVVLGSSQDDPELWRRVAHECSTSKYVRVCLQQDEKIVHLIFAGADAFIVPSNFEPCGLTQMIAMRYGSIPVVRAVGGLRDTVREGGDDMNGFVFWHNCIWQFGEALERAFKAWRDPATQETLTKRVMNIDLSWRRPAAEYVAVYRSMMSKAASARNGAFLTEHRMAAFQRVGLDGGEHAFYVSKTGHVAEYYRNLAGGGDKWAHADISTAAGLDKEDRLAWAAVGTPCAFCQEDGSQHAYVRGSDHRMYAFQTDKAGWKCIDISQNLCRDDTPSLPEVGSDPSGFPKKVGNRVEHHLFYLSTKGHVIHLFNAGDGRGWHAVDLHECKDVEGMPQDKPLVPGAGRVSAFRCPPEELRCLWRGKDGHVYVFFTLRMRRYLEDCTPGLPSDAWVEEVAPEAGAAGDVPGMTVTFESEDGDFVSVAEKKKPAKGGRAARPTSSDDLSAGPGAPGRKNSLLPGAAAQTVQFSAGLSLPPRRGNMRGAMSVANLDRLADVDHLAAEAAAKSRSAAAGPSSAAPPAAALGDPAPLVQGTAHHVAVARDGTVLFCYKKKGKDGKEEWARDDLFELCGFKGQAPPAVGDCATVVVGGKELAIFYRGNDHHVYQFYTTPAGWKHRDLTGIYRVPLAAADPVAYLEESTGTYCVYFSTQPDGTVTHLRFSDGGWGDWKDCKSDVVSLLALLTN